MSYIEHLAPRDYTFCTLFAYPYQEGVRNLESCADRPTLWGRVKQALVGIALLIPLINTVVFLILRSCTAPPVIFDREDTAAPAPEVIPAEIVRLNEARNRAITAWQEQTGAYEDIAAIEAEAIDQMEILVAPEVGAHLRLSEQRHPDLVVKDGRIWSSCYRRAECSQPGFPTAGFTQVGGAHQYRGTNYLCGYYALFFMYQAVSGQKAFADREQLHPMLVRWTHMIACKRAKCWLSNHRDQQIPATLQTYGRGLSRDDIQYLIENDPALESLQSRANCFVLEMDEFYAENYPQPITPIGSKAMVQEFPLYFLLKEGQHYFFVWAEQPWEFKVVHSLGSSIHNKLLFREDAFFDIVQAIATHRIDGQS